MRQIRSVSCEHEVVKQEQVTGATVKRSLRVCGGGFEVTPKRVWRRIVRSRIGTRFQTTAQ